MDEKDFYKIIGKIEVLLDDKKQAEVFSNTINEMVNMLDQADEDDYFGTEGWRHHLGWDE